MAMQMESLSMPTKPESLLQALIASPLGWIIGLSQQEDVYKRQLIFKHIAGEHPSGAIHVVYTFLIGGGVETGGADAALHLHTHHAVVDYLADVRAVHEAQHPDRAAVEIDLDLNAAKAATRHVELFYICLLYTSRCV